MRSPSRGGSLGGRNGRSGLGLHRHATALRDANGVANKGGRDGGHRGLRNVRDLVLSTSQ